MLQIFMAWQRFRFYTLIIEDPNPSKTRSQESRGTMIYLEVSRYAEKHVIQAD